MSEVKKLQLKHLMTFEHRRGNRGEAVEAARPHNSGAVGAVPPQLFTWLGTVEAVVLSKLGVKGNK